MQIKVQDRPEIAIFSEISLIDHHLRAIIGRHLPRGMTHAHFELLTHFTRHGDGQTPAQLARLLMMTKGAMTNVLQRMEADGPVTVLADVGDGRKKRVKMTRKGGETYVAINRGLRSRSEALRSGFTDEEFLEAMPFLKALRVFLEDLSSNDEPEAVSRR